MGYTSKSTLAVEVACDGCDKSLFEVDEGVNASGYRLAESLIAKHGWLNLVVARAVRFVAPADAQRGRVLIVDGQQGSTIIACSIPCAQKSMGTFLSKHAQPVSATPTAHDPLASL